MSFGNGTGFVRNAGSPENILAGLEGMSAEQKEDAREAISAEIEHTASVIGSSSGHTGSLTDEGTRMVDLTLDSDATLAINDLPAAANLALVIRQDIQGGWTATWPGTVEWDGGVAPTLTKEAFGYDVIDILSLDGTNLVGKKRATVPGQAVVDNFNRANSATLGNATPVTEAWTQVSGAFAISSNVAVTVANQTECLAVVDSNRSAAYTIVARIRSNALVNRTNVAFVTHYVDSSNFMSVGLQSIGVPGLGDIYKKQSGSFTFLGAGSGSTVLGTNQWFDIEIDVLATGVVLRVNGVFFASHTFTGPEAALYGAAFSRMGVRSYTASDNDAGGSAYDAIRTIPYVA